MKRANERTNQEREDIIKLGERKKNRILNVLSILVLPLITK